jgi:AraC family transcriptional regulator, transcriptional activator of pobA
LPPSTFNLTPLRLKTLTTITDYCKEINIAPPRYGFFDIRAFEENMKTVNLKQPPFRHEFYSIALRHAGTNNEVMGTPLQTNIFFNSPYQIVTWDILPDWKGWYIMLDKEFVSMNPAWSNFIIDYPFFRLDKYIPFDMPPDEAQRADQYFRKIFEEYHSNNKDKFQFILAYTQLLLLLTKRYFEKIDLAKHNIEDNNRTADILLVSRFQTLIETLATNKEVNTEVRRPSYYSERLSIHPNHLNAVVKRITGKTASQLIQHQLIKSAESMLRQTGLSIKEIGFRLHFSEPTHFNAFFKKHAGQTPQKYRDNVML